MVVRIFPIINTIFIGCGYSINRGVNNMYKKYMNGDRYMNKLICYKKCTTCKAVEKIMKDLNIDYEIREIDKENPTKEELKAWKEVTGLPLKRFFNTSGKIYKDLGLSQRLKDMPEEDQYELLATDGMLVKRPILFTGDGLILVGPDVKKYLLGELNEDK